MTHDRRSALAALGATLPFGWPLLPTASAAAGPAPVLRLRPFEEAVRAGFAAGETACRVAVGHSDVVAVGVQGCVNDRPFAGFPAGRLRIVRTGSAPGPVVHGVRLYVATVDLVRSNGATPGRPFDFASLPPAPTLAPPAGMVEIEASVGA